MLRLLQLVALGVLFALCSCSSTGAKTNKPIDVAGMWRLVELPAANLAEYDEVMGRRPEMELSRSGRLTGFSGVNQVSCSFDATAAAKGSFATGPLAVTRMAGPPRAMEVESVLLAALASATGIRVEGERLVLDRGNTLVARFERRK